MQLSMGYPSKAGELEILKTHRSVTDVVNLNPVASAEDVLAMQKQVENVHCDEKLMNYIVDIVEATRSYDGVLIGASPRGSIALLQAACGHAMLNGRDFVTPDDIKKLAPYVLCHRIIMRGRAGIGANAQLEVVNNILKNIKIPKAE